MTGVDVPAVPVAPADPVRTAPGRPWFPCLDGLRGLAALLVVVFHVSGAVADHRQWTAGAWLARAGNVGVSLFFVLSGFLLARPFFAAHLAGARWPRVDRYLVRRLARIVPAYWVALTVWLFVVRDPKPSGAPGDPYALLYLFGQVYRAGYVDGKGALSVAWTLCIEVTFYVVLPPLAWLLCRLAGRGPAARRVRVLTLACLGLAVVGVLVRWWLLSPRPGDTNWALVAYWLPGHIGWFGLGMAVAAVSAGAAVGVRPPRWLRDLAGVPALALAAAVGVYWLTTLLPVRKPIQTVEELVIIFVANGIASTLLLVPFVVGDQDRGRVRALLASRPARWLGEVSYGLYLWHTIVLYQVNKWVRAGDLSGSAPVRLALVLAVGLALAQASWVLVERPVLRVAARVGTAR